MEACLKEDGLRECIIYIIVLRYHSIDSVSGKATERSKNNLEGSPGPFIGSLLLHLMNAMQIITILLLNGRKTSI